MDLAFQLCNIKNLVVVPSDKAKEVYLRDVYPYNIDCYVITAQEAKTWQGDYKVVFFGCWVDNLSNCENIIMDDIVFRTWSPKPYSVRWEPESLATFISCWFNQGKLRKMNNDPNWRFEHGKPSEGRNDWLRNIMI